MNLHEMLWPRTHPRATSLPQSTGAHPGDGRVHGPATRDLRDALEILAEQMHDAVGRRRMSQPGTEPHRRADERVALVLELFGELRQGTSIPDDVWRLPMRPHG
jgi:hypothetical protein